MVRVLQRGSNSRELKLKLGEWREKEKGEDRTVGMKGER